MIATIISIVLTLQYALVMMMNTTPTPTPITITITNNKAKPLNRTLSNNNFRWERRFTSSKEMSSLMTI